jgi:transcriptional regulator with XRE-family HTH domain
VEFVKRICHQMAPHASFPANIFRIDVDCHVLVSLCRMCKYYAHMTPKLNAASAANLANDIRAARRSRGMTLKKLGLECGVHHSQLSRIEQGKMVRVSKNLECICTFLQIEIFPSEGHSRLKLPLLSRIERLVTCSKTSERAIESLVSALEELTFSSRD